MSKLNREEEEALAKVGPGTPSGELFRRYWIPVEVSENLEVGDAPRSSNGPKNPMRLKVLGEELVLWRSADGTAHLMDEHCAHRGTSLAFGRVEDNCLRCIYHGWSFRSDGQCVDMPAEPPASKFKDGIRQRTYPTYEIGGLIFAYMGPPDRQPVFPRYDSLFREDGVRITGRGGYIQQCNVFQAMHDNNLDVWHPEFLHGWLLRNEMPTKMHHGRDGRPPTPVRYDRTPWGTRDMVLKDTNTDGVYEYYELHTIWPSARANQGAMRFATPVDDVSTRWFTVEFFPFGTDGELTEDGRRSLERRAPFTMQSAVLERDWFTGVQGWWDWDNPMRRGILWEDEIACGTQGTAERNGLPDWEKWNLASSDRGLLLNRRVWRDAIAAVERGDDPIHVIRDRAEDELIMIPANRVFTSWEDGLRMIDQTAEERVAEMREQNVSTGMFVWRAEHDASRPA